MDTNILPPEIIIQNAGAIDAEFGEVSRKFFERKFNPPVEHPNIPAFDIPELPIQAKLSEDLGADACPWLDDYINFSRLWSPRSFDDYHEACAIWMLSTVAARRIKTEFGGQRHTPLYILLSGRSSLYAKTTTANIALAVLREAQLNYILAPDQSTPQKFTSLLASHLPDDFDSLNIERQSLVKKRLSLLGARGWFHEEFGSHVSSMMQANSYMADFRGLLRKIDDCPDRYETATVTRGVEVIEKPYLALLGNLTPADLRRFAQKGSELWGDGFLARFGIVGPSMDDSGKTGRFPGGDRIIPFSLTDPLKRWDDRLGHGQVSILPLPTKNKSETESFPGERLEITAGQITTIPMSGPVIERFYQYLDGLTYLTQNMDTTDLDGNYIRFPEKALRISCLLASMTNSSQIELNHWARAQAITERWRAGLHALYFSVNNDRSVARENEERVLKIIQKLGGWATPTEVSRYIRALSSNEVRTILEDLANVQVLEMRKEGRAERYGFPI